jgi:hypothetical protein
MCTVTFIPRDTGYYLAMNRDEQMSRVAGLPPKQHFINGRAVLFPSEPNGGTWIALNDTGSCLALVNWYSVAARVNSGPVSRGEVIKSACGFATSDLVEAELKRLSLHRMNPFRLIGIFPVDRKVTEWRWDLNKLVRKNHRWKAQQWISSGFDEPAAQRSRGKTFREAQSQRSAGSLDWLRRLHRSHLPHRGAFSTCVHRSDAMTVSYAEISVSPGKASMRYHPAAPCQKASSGKCSHDLQVGSLANASPPYSQIQRVVERSGTRGSVLECASPLAL